MVVIPLIAGLITYYFAKNAEDEYSAKATIYTGIMTGTSVDGAAVENPAVTMQNLLMIVKTECTVRETVFRLFVQCIQKGSVTEDTQTILAEHYRSFIKDVPMDIIEVCQNNSEADAVAILKKDYYKERRDNFLYGLFNYYHPYFCISTVATKITALRVGESDMMEVTYYSNDPGISYTTLKILNEEFIKQYQILRFGETIDVINYFRHQVDSTYRELDSLERRLLRYNVKHGIINYGEQSKQIAILDATYLGRLQSLIVDLKTTDDLMKFYTDNLNDQNSQLLSNASLLKELDNFSKKSRERSMVDTYKTVDPKAEATQRKIEGEIEESKERLHDIVKSVVNTKNGLYNIKDQQLALEWLEQMVNNIKTHSEKETMPLQREMLNSYIVSYSPVGVTIGHFDRSIGFTQDYYTQMQNNLNAAILHQQNLRISTSSLRVMNEPLFPLHAEPHNIMMTVLTAVLVAAIFVFTFFLLIELLDHTLRDRMRTERLTGEKVIGCYPSNRVFAFRRYRKVVTRMAAHQLINTMNEFIRPDKPKIINLISTGRDMGKEELASILASEWKRYGFNVRYVQYGDDFNVDSVAFQMATNINDIVPDYDPSQILLVKYPSVHEVNIPADLLNTGTVNILVCRADKGWKSSDRIALKKIRKFLNPEVPFYIYLMRTSREAVEEFTGQLPPYTPYQNWVYRMLQFGLTEKS
jgi:uncharacterized protein involved in exopolysaccharide biosynthesis